MHSQMSFELKSRTVAKGTLAETEGMDGRSAVIIEGTRTRTGEQRCQRRKNQVKYHLFPDPERMRRLAMK